MPIYFRRGDHCVPLNNLHQNNYLNPFSTIVSCGTQWLKLLDKTFYLYHELMDILWENIAWYSFTFYYDFLMVLTQLIMAEKFSIFCTSEFLWRGSQGNGKQYQKLCVVKSTRSQVTISWDEQLYLSVTEFSLFFHLCKGMKTSKIV